MANYEEGHLHILFVCTGNICRSPTAERLAVEYATRLGDIGHFHASSAGTRAVVSHPIHPDARAVLERLGGSSSNFTARQLTPSIAAEADLILTMTAEHRNRVLQIVPNRLHRTFTLGEASRLVSDCNAGSIDDLRTHRARLAGTSDTDVPDPIGEDSGVFAAVGSQIAALLPPILRLCQITNGSSG